MSAEFFQLGAFDLFKELFNVIVSRVGSSEPNLASRKLENWSFSSRNLMLLNVLNY